MPMHAIEVKVTVRSHRDAVRTDPRNPPPPGAVGPVISSVEGVFPAYNESLRVASSEAMERAAAFVEAQARLADPPNPRGGLIDG